MFHEPMRSTSRGTAASWIKGAIRSLGLGRLAAGRWLEQEEIRPRVRIKSADVPRRTCMWNAPIPPFNWPEAYAPGRPAAKFLVRLRQMRYGAIVFGLF